MDTKLEVAAPVTPIVRPEFIRMPKAGSVCMWTGLSRSHLFALAQEGKIRTVSLRKRGAARGVRLIRLDSVIEYIGRMEREHAEEAK